MCFLSSCQNSSEVSEGPVLLRVLQSTSENGRTRVGLEFVIPDGHHIFSAEDQSVGRKTSLMFRQRTTAIPALVTWPQPMQRKNETLGQEYFAYEGRQQIIANLVHGLVENKKVTVFMDYILCDVQCVPGESSTQFLLP